MARIRIPRIIRRITREAFNKAGLELTTIEKSPKHNLLGLRNFGFRSIIDVGANSGQFAKEAVSAFPNATIYCVEPIPHVFDRLNDWARTQDGKVKAFNLALGDREERSDLFLHVDHTYSSSLLKTTDEAIRVFPQMRRQSRIRIDVTTLDLLMRRLSTEVYKEILIKLDVQGYEDRVILGGTETFRRSRACILEINLDRFYETQPDFVNLSLLLRGLGYRYAGNLDQVYSGDGHVSYIDSVFFRDLPVG